MRIIVVGAGGVGGLIGGLLQRSGQQVAFLARGRQLQALRDGGLRVQSPRGTFHLPRVEASDDPAALPPADVVLVATKGWQVPEVAPQLARLLGPDGFAVPLENGVEAAGHLVAALGEARVAGGLCFLLSRIEAPGHIQHMGESLRVTVGERGGGTSSRRLEALCAVLRAAHVDAELAPDIDAALWDKFLFIEPFGAVGAVTRSPVGVFRSRRESRELLVSAMDEVAALARARGVRLAADAVARALQSVDRMPAEATASMQRDIMSGRPSELGDQTGAVMRLALGAALPVPVHAFLWAALVPQEDAARPQPRQGSAPGAR
jgi:2-dehydropantoate 2-reductase